MWYRVHMRITALEPQATNAERINLYVDGHFLLGVSAEVVLQMGLQLEQELLPTSVSPASTMPPSARALVPSCNAAVSVMKSPHAPYVLCGRS